MRNPNCDGEGPCFKGEVRKLKIGADSNAILCRLCFNREMRFREERNAELDADCRFELPTWESLPIYADAQGKVIA